MSTSPSPSASDNARYPSANVRTFITLVLIIHLFALVVAMMSTRMGLTSPLQLQLRTVPVLSRYLQWLWMDLNYDYYYTNGEVNHPQTGERMAVTPGADFDHYIEISMKKPDGEQVAVTLPEAAFPRQRYLREQRLADEIVRRIGDSNHESRLPAEITRFFMENYGAESAEFRCIEQAPIAPEVLTEPTDDLASRDPEDARYFTVVFEGTARLVKGNFVFQKIESARDSAPAVNAPSAAGTNSGSQNN